MWAALEGFATIAVVVAVGYLLARTRVVGGSAQKSLGDVAFYVGQPALVLVAVAGADLDLLVGPHVAAFALACILTGLAFGFLLVRRGRTRAEAALGYLSVSYVNAGNLGMPIAAFMLGDAAWAATAMLVQVLLLQPSAVAVLESSPAGRGHSVARSFLTHPLVWGAALGLALNLTDWQPPSVLGSPMTLLSELAIPAMLLAFGMSLHSNPLPRLSRLPRLTLAAIATKSLLVPAVTLGLAVLLGLTGTPLRAAVILAALPTAQVVFVHALRYRTALSLVQATTLWSTLLSVPVIIAAGAFLH